MKKVRIGVFGLGRGGFAVRYCNIAKNAEVVAICDRLVDKLDRFRAEGIACFDNFDDFIQYDMDAVILANYANEHAPYAIKAMKAGKHVLSEVLPFQCLKEGVELVETVEETGMIYAYAENYCYMPCNLEMRRMIRDGRLGTFEYGEGEYMHNCEPGWENLSYADLEIDDPGLAMGFPAELCQRVHTEACRTMRLFNG